MRKTERPITFTFRPPRNLSLPPSRTRLTMSLLLAFIATAAVLLALDLLTAPKHRETSSALKDGRRAA